MDFGRLISILNSDKPQRGWYTEMSGMLVPLHTGAGTE
jgi:hypothetical protein